MDPRLDRLCHDRGSERSSDVENGLDTGVKEEDANGSSYSDVSLGVSEDSEQRRDGAMGGGRRSKQPMSTIGMP